MRKKEGYANFEDVQEEWWRFRSTAGVTDYSILSMDSEWTKWFLFTFLNDEWWFGSGSASVEISGGTLNDPSESVVE